VNFYGKEQLPAYLLAVANIVGGLFQDPSLSYPINITVVRTVIFEKDIFNASTIGNLLGRWSDWVQKDNPTDDDDPRHYDNAILLTRNGCHSGCGLSGLAYNGMCGVSTSQSVSVDNGLMTALTAAHELAHNLDVGHDNSADCPDAVNIMATGSISGPSAFQWSKCSSKKIHDQLVDDSVSKCFDDKPSSYPFPHPENLTMYGQAYNLSVQCEWTFGDDYTMCSFFQDRCQSLYCRRKGFATCILNPYPVAHGTKCGDRKWCIHGECVPDGTPAPDPIDGQWGEWGEFTGGVWKNGTKRPDCSKECGIGLQWRERSCDSPAPQHGGRDCAPNERGETYRGAFKSCKIQDCPQDSPYLKYRELQCKQFGERKTDVFDENQQCKLVCGEDSNYFYFGNVEDGTRCNPNFQENNVCIGGACRTVGCDLELESGNIEDRCGVCEGDGSSCEHVNGTDMNPYPRQGYFPIVQVPAHSTNIDIRELGRTMTFIGFKVHGQSNLAIRIPSWSTQYNFPEGGTVYYEMRDYQYPDVLRAHIIPKGIDVFVVNPYMRRSQGVYYSFYKPTAADARKSPVLYWDYSEWGECSKSCAGGTQMRVIYCKRHDDNSKLSNPRCDYDMKINGSKPNNTQNCNMHDCPAEWHVSDWSECSTSCGNGTRTRRIFCAALNYKSAYEEVTGAAATCDPALKPDEPIIEQCSLSTCPAKWVPQAWSQCSTTCGPGRMSRLITCERINADGGLAIRPELECSFVQKPPSLATCNDDSPCAEWTTVYGSCSTTCGRGVQIASLACTIPPSTTPVPDNKCDASKKPDPSTLKDKLCNLGSCEVYRWKNDTGICSVTCGDGVIPVTTVCVSSVSGLIVDRSLCKPSEDPGNSTIPCNEGVCPDTHVWKTKYSACSQTCGNGTKTLVVYCTRMRDGATVADIMCDASTKPTVVVQTCNEGVCAPRYAWRTSYGECSVTCSTGLHKKIYTCVNAVDGKSVDSSLCSHLNKPTFADKPCNEGDCPPTYSWKVQYLPCNVTCGNGIEKVDYICVRDGDGQTMADSLCSGLKKPLAWNKRCSLPSCHYWNATYGPCNAQCGDGFRLKIVECIERKSQTVVDNSKCIDEDEPADVACKKDPCVPAFTFGGLPAAYAVGCYKDNPSSRRMPRMIGNFRSHINDWFNLTNVIELCANQAYNRVFDFFSLQFFGECWGGPSSAGDTYYLDGVSTDCYRGTGKSGTNFIYKFQTPQSLPTLPAIQRLGCYKDDLKDPRPVPLLIDNFRSSTGLTNDEKIMRCAVAARRRGLELFALQYSGECWSGRVVDYSRAGDSDKCHDGIGGINSFNVYRFVSS